MIINISPETVHKNIIENSIEKSVIFVRRFIGKFKNKKTRKSAIKDIAMILSILFVLFVTCFILWAASLRTPDLGSFDARLLGQSAKIYDRTGTILLYDLSQKVRRTVVHFDTISPYIKNATVAIEDSNFYNHKGIQPKSIIRAILANITTMSYGQGGSTITQQVVKNSLLTKDKDISRKIKEWILAIKLEKNATKDEILNLYLNESPYGGNIYGIEEAAEAFFDKNSSDVTLAEAAYLAALPQSPTALSPYGKNKQRLDDRKNLVLKQMLQAGMISQEEHDKAVAEEVLFQPKSVTGIKAPHFVMYLKEYLEEKYGDDLLQLGGFKVISTIDYDLQEKAEEIVSNYVKTTGVKTYKATNGAMVAIDPKTGQILMMVGSRDYFDTEIQGNFNVATARRQPGSAFKPFVYATAFMKGFTPDTPLFDVPTEFNASCPPGGQKTGPNGAKCYSPENYEGGYKGLMSVRKALAESRNIPAVKALYIAGVDESIKTATNMGVTGLRGAEQYGLSLALGGAEVSPLDMASAYGVFAQNGVRNPVTSILKIEKSNGEIVEEFKPEPEQVIDSQVARQINDILADKYARAPIFGVNYFANDRQVGIKTGTTNSSRDAWTVGYTPSISVSGWMGNNDNTPMAQQASARIIGPMWKSFMDYALARVPVETFEEPDPIDQNLKPYLRGAWQTSSGEVHSELFWVDRGNVKGTEPGYGSKDSLFKNFEAGIYAYNGTFSGSWGTGATNPNPNGGVNSSSSEPIPNQTPVTNLQITYPTPNTAVNGLDRIMINVSGTKSTTNQVQYYINGSPIGVSNQAPFTFSFIPSQTPGIEDENELKAVSIDQVGKSQESKIYFSVIR